MTFASLLWILVALGALHVLVVLAFVGSIVLPNPVRQLQRRGAPATYGLDPVDVRLPDGSPAWLFAHGGPPRRTVLVCHGRSRSKRWMLPLVARLFVKRYDVLAFDFPGHGDHAYSTTTVGLREADAVAAALAWLRNSGRNDLVVYGVSMGGAAALIALGAAPQAGVRGLITDGTFDRLDRVVSGILDRIPVLPGYLRAVAESVARVVVGVRPSEVRPVDYAAAIDVPVLLLHGRADTLVPPICSEVLAETIGSRATYAPYNGGHDDPENDEMQAAVLAFVDRA